MITYDRTIRQAIHSALRRICGPISGARCRAGIDATGHVDDETAVTCIGSGRRGRNPALASRKRRLAGLAIAAIVLAALIAPSQPAQAQDGATPPISATASTTLYLPSMARNWHAWFDDAELTDAMRRAGYDPATASMHTVCTLDPTAVPPYLMRYTACEQYWLDGQPTEGTGRFVWYIRMGSGVVTGVEVGQ